MIVTTRKMGIGIEGIEEPEEKCSDKNCPFHGNLSIRGQIQEGVVTSDRPEKTVKVSWMRVHKLPKFERFERRKSSVMAHNPPCINAEKGDRVKVAECRPLSKTKSFVVVAKVEGDESS